MDFTVNDVFTTERNARMWLSIQAHPLYAWQQWNTPGTDAARQYCRNGYTHGVATDDRGRMIPLRQMPDVQISLPPFSLLTLTEQDHRLYSNSFWIYAYI